MFGLDTQNHAGRMANNVFQSLYKRWRSAEGEVPAPVVWTGADSARPLRAGETRDAAQPAMMALMLGVYGPEREHKIGAAVRGAKRAGAVTVVVVDDLDFAALRAVRTPFEYLPPAEKIAADVPRDLAQSYRRRRTLVLLQKWRPWRVISFSDEARTLVAELAEQPSLDDDLRQVLGFSPQIAG